MPHDHAQHLAVHLVAGGIASAGLCGEADYGRDAGRAGQSPRSAPSRRRQAACTRPGSPRANLVVLARRHWRQAFPSPLANRRPAAASRPGSPPAIPVVLARPRPGRQPPRHLAAVGECPNLASRMRLMGRTAPPKITAALHLPARPMAAQVKGFCASKQGYDCSHISCLCYFLCYCHPSNLGPRQAVILNAKTCQDPLFMGLYCVCQARSRNRQKSVKSDSGVLSLFSTRPHLPHCHSAWRRGLGRGGAIRLPSPTIFPIRDEESCACV